MRADLRRIAVFACAAGLLASAAGRPSSAADQGPSARGITWPADRAFPQFATAEHFDVADLDGVPPNERLLFATLQGLVNRGKPRIFLLEHAGEGKTTWLDALGVPHASADRWSLLGKYRAEIKGIIVDDPAVPATVNVATTLAGLDDAIVASPDLVTRLTTEQHFKILEDLRGRFKDDLAADTWEVDQLWPRTTHRMLVGIGPDEYAGFRDYPVAVKALAIALRVGVPAERALWERMIHDMPPNSPYVGWFPNQRGSNEIPGIWFLTEHGMYDVAGDLFQNMTAFSGVAAPALAHPQPAVAALPLQNKIYVTFTESDGDNLQFMQHRMRILWDDPARGRVPMNWTVQPLAADCAPMLLEYYRKTATPNDYLIAGPSGAGYAFVSTFPPAAYRTYAEQTGRYFARTGIRVSEVHNFMRGGPVPIPDDQAAILVAGANPLGILTGIQGVGPKAMVFGGRLMGATQLYVHDVPGAQQKIAQYAADWDGRTPRFLAVYMGAWSEGPSDAAAIAASLGPNYQVVRGDQFFELARAANGLPRD